LKKTLISKTKSVGMCGNEIRRLKLVIGGGKIVERVTEFNYIRSKFSKYKEDVECKLQTYNTISGAIKINCGKQISIQTTTDTLQRKQLSNAEVRRGC
jgi:hypothetical protein